MEAVMQLRESLEQVIKQIPKLQGNTERIEIAKDLLGLVERLINPGIQMNARQAGHVAYIVAEEWTNRKQPPSFVEVLTVATFVNSCKLYKG